MDDAGTAEGRVKVVLDGRGGRAGKGEVEVGKWEGELDLLAALSPLLSCCPFAWPKSLGACCSIGVPRISAGLSRNNHCFCNLWGSGQISFTPRSLCR